MEEEDQQKVTNASSAEKKDTGQTSVEKCHAEEEETAAKEAALTVIPEEGRIRTSYF